MTGVQRGVHGHSGSLSARELLRCLETLGCTGTLVLERGPSALLLLLHQGRVAARHTLGAAQALESATWTFHFEPHDPSPRPQLGSRYPGSVSPLLRAVPALGFDRLPSLLDLQSLLSQLREEAFSGCLALETPLGQGVALLEQGRVSAAVFEEEGLLREKNEALRAMRRNHVGASDAELWLRALDPFFVQSLLGLASGQRWRPDGSFSGLESSEEGYAYVKEGQPVLLVKAELRGASARYALGADLPELALPNEPPGWEQQRFQLTLRGRDALNPMTEVALNFQSSFGRTGRQLLEQLDKGLTLERVSQVLTIELSELKPWLGKLEGEGLVRLVKTSA